MRKWLKISLVLLVFVFGAAIFYFYFPQIWGSMVYPLKYEDLIVRYAKAYKLSPSFIAAVIYTESRFNENAVSGAGARGLMQIMPSTGARLAKTLGDKDFSRLSLFEPERNIRYGTYYLRELIDRHNGDLDKALIAYNGGEQAVIAYERRAAIPRETTSFVRKVKSAWDMYQKVHGLKWQEEELKELEKQREAEKIRELQRKIEERMKKGEILKEETRWEFKIFWPTLEFFKKE